MPSSLILFGIVILISNIPASFSKSIISTWASISTNRVSERTHVCDFDFISQRGGATEEEYDEEFDNEHTGEDDEEDEDHDVANSQYEVDSSEDDNLSVKSAKPSTGITAFFDTLGLLIQKVLSVFVPVSEESGRPISQESSTFTSSTIIKGSFQGALEASRSTAKLLVVYIPSGKSNARAADAACLKSLMSSDVIEVSQTYKKGSYLIWISPNTGEANKAIKRLRIKTNPKAPTLAVAYPAQVLDSTRGKFGIVPKVLAQHHCQPPPSHTAMVAWLKSLRQRHAKLVAKMKHLLKEQELFAERQKGYKESLKDDEIRVKQEAHEKLQKEREEQLEKEQQAQRKQKRQELMNSLPPEPQLGEDGTITVGLRFPDGQSAQRRFQHSDEFEHVFHWVDGEFDIKSEDLSLSTMTGSKTFIYGDIDGSIGELIGTNKMVALRVLTKAKEEEVDEESDENKSKLDTQS